MVYAHIIHHKRLFFCLGIILAGILSFFLIYQIPLIHDHPIRSDGIGYYLYLPATFIYHDISLQRIATTEFSGSIPDWTGALVYPQTQQYLIKYPMGEAILLTPFFLIAYILTFITHMKMDGFSFFFQYATAISGLLYTTVGVAILWNILQKHFKERTILLVLCGIVFGTNLFHYATYDAIFSHTYSFFLFCAFLFLIIKIYTKPSMRYVLLTGVVTGLIIITRPTNILFLIFGCLYGVTSIETLIKRFHFWINHTKEGFLIMLPALAIVVIQMAYWKLITGHYIVYAYTETFNFLKPEILYVLFSVNKGLFFWSPILVTIIPGLFFLKKKAPQFFVPTCIYIPLNLYIIASWNNGWCGGSFGSRFFVDSLPVFAISLCALYDGIKNPVWKHILTGFIFLCIMLSIFLMIQYWIGTIPFDEVTWGTFGTLIQKILN